MELLLTGGTGLVGARMLGRLLAAGIDCRALVRPGRQLPAGVQRCEGDILSPDTLAVALDGVDAVVHLAASFRSGDEQETWRVNLEGTGNLIEAAQTHAPGVRFVMASTSNVYAADASRPAREDDAVHPTLAYPASKLRAEEALRASKLNWSVLRLPFVYGDRDGHLESMPARLAEMGWHPAQRMSVAHHQDVAAAFELALSGALDQRIVNITDDATLTIYELARLVDLEYPTSAEPVVNPWRGHIDSSLARRLGFQPAIRTVYQAVTEGRM